MIGLEGVYHKYFAERGRPPRFAAVQQLRPGEIQNCVHQAKTLIPTADPVSIGLNSLRNGTLKVDMVHWDTKLIRELSSYVIFDANTLQPAETYDASKTNVGTRFYYAMEPLHFGRLGGSLVVKLLWGVMGLTGGFLSVSGFLIYLLRKKSSRKTRVATQAYPQTFSKREPVTA